jgi:hypothetical protein
MLCVVKDGPQDTNQKRPCPEQLFLEENFLTGTLPIQIGFCTNLFELRLNGNVLNGTLASELGSLSALGTRLIKLRQCQDNCR